VGDGKPAALKKSTSSQHPSAAINAQRHNVFRIFSFASASRCKGHLIALLEYRMRIFCDFDGTISLSDTADLILTEFADPIWEEIEAEWVAGEIDSATCMARQIPLINAPLAAIDELLDTVELRDGFASFLGWTRRRSVPVQIVSDGVDYFIRRILARHDIHDVPIIANRLVQKDGLFSLEQPWRIVGCGSGVCKCHAVEVPADGSKLVFVGDGRSDFCVASRPDILFATNSLESYCADREIAHVPFTSFASVQSALERIAAGEDDLAAVA
jgi:2-hydroxy-3-keto-5-methylthiopentenyl-1-phosphate phosphatase